MYRAGRPADPHFEPDERLFHRCLKVHLEFGRVLPAAFRSPDFSVNRSKYSEPVDVLVPVYRRWGIACFEVAVIPSEMSSPGGVSYQFQVDHIPEEDNYAHSEVRTYKSGKHSRKLKVHDVVKKQFRQILSDSAILLKDPGE
jgi:hypothetical protein